MDTTTILLALLLVTVILVAVFILVQRSRSNLSARLDALLKDQLTRFQDQIHRELNVTRLELNQSKDIISKHTIKTLDTIKEMGDTIQKITQQQEEAQKLGQSLKDLLQAPKLRGNYGEAILEEMLERILPRSIWERQYAIEGQQPVDAVVKMRDVIIPIDAKFPRDNYQKYLDSEDTRAKEEFWKAFENDVKKQIKSISSKYIKPEKGTTDFALMFIPSEATYYETIADKNFLGQPSKLVEYAQQHRVIPVSPNIFYAFLQVMIIGIRNLEIIKSARSLQENLSALQRSFDYFFQHYSNIGSYLEKSAEAYRKGEKHVQRYKKRLDQTLESDALKQIPEIGESPENGEAPSADQR